MTTSRDPDRLIHAYLLEGAEHLQDRVYDEVRADIEKRRQRGRFGPWRTPDVNPLLKIALPAAAVLVIAVVGFQLLGGSNTGGPVPTVTPGPTSAPTAANGGLPLGPFALVRANSVAAFAMTVTIGAAAWYGEGNGILVKNDDADPPDGAGMIVFAEGDGWYVPGDPCDWDSTMPDTRSTTVDELVAALAAQASREASAPVDITLDGYAGRAITLHVPDDAVFANCDQEHFCTLADPVTFPADACARYHQGPGQIDNLWIVDVNGQLVVIDWAVYEATPTEDVAELEAIVKSMTFE